jgi:hypothetical protein
VSAATTADGVRAGLFQVREGRLACGPARRSPRLNYDFTSALAGAS